MPRLTSLRTMLAANDLNETIAFYRDRLGFECTSSWGHDMSQPTWCNLSRDGISIMFSKAEDAHTHDDGSSHEAEIPGMTGSIYFNVDDVDGLFESLRPTVDQFEWEPTSWDHGMRDIGVRDPNGYLLVFATPLD
jgi:uncharacterized glyoxalase superfamily protein PhnB